jgi:predicted Zn-dependent protease
VATKGVADGQFRLISGETRCLAVSVAGKEVREESGLEKRNAKFGKDFNAEGTEDAERKRRRAGGAKLEKRNAKFGTSFNAEIAEDAESIGLSCELSVVSSKQEPSEWGGSSRSMREVEEKDAEGSPQDGRELFEWRLAYTRDSSTDGWACQLQR